MIQNTYQVWMTAALVTVGTTALGPVVADNDDATIQAHVAAAKAASGEFVKQLGGTMMREMKKGGPVAAMKVCRDVAPSITNDMSLQKGWKMTRVGTRVRNPMLGTPDVWEQQVLLDFERRAAQGEQFDKMFHFEVVEEPAGKSLRYMKAIGVATQCLTCHGGKEQIPENVRDQLQVMYPHDRAIGYQPGDLRGAVSIKLPLDG